MTQRQILMAGVLTTIDIDDCISHVYAWWHRHHVRQPLHNRPFSESALDRVMHQQRREHLDLPLCDL